MRRLALLCVIVSFGASFSAHAQSCLSSKRAPGEEVFYPSIYLDMSQFPSGFHDALVNAQLRWNDSDCNYQDRFPILQTFEPATRTIRFFYQAGFHTDDRVCGTFNGQDVTVFQFAKNQFNETIPCTRSDVLKDVLAHEIGHVYSLNDTSCTGYMMSRSSGGTTRTPPRPSARKSATSSTTPTSRRRRRSGRRFARRTRCSPSVTPPPSAR